MLRLRGDVATTRVFVVAPSPGFPRWTVGHWPTPASVGSGCVEPPPSTFLPGYVVCPTAVPRREVRYRISLGDGLQDVEVGGFIRGVIYAGAGDDEVIPGDRVYGGPGDDTLHGGTVYGGPGDDMLEDLPGFGVLRGGAGDDQLVGFYGGRLYGGRGDDALDASGPGEMVVGGPGRDLVSVLPDSGAPDVVRLRGGGRDRLFCNEGPLGASEVVYVDRRDRIDPDCGDKARIVTVGRPRAVRAAQDPVPASA